MFNFSAARSQATTDELFTVNVGESGVDIWRNSAEHHTDLLRVIAVDGHSTRPVLTQSPVLITTEQIHATVETAQTHRRRVNTRN